MSMKQCKNKKSTGLDRIPSTFFTNYSISISKTLYSHFSLDVHFPSSWKCSQITSIPKKEENSLIPGSCRPIFNLLMSAKNFERIINLMIDEHCDRQNSIADFQFANRTGHSVEHDLLVMKSIVLLGISHKTPTTACLLDIRKAFDTVWKYGLV